MGAKFTMTVGLMILCLILTVAEGCKGGRLKYAATWR